MPFTGYKKLLLIDQLTLFSPILDKRASFCCNSRCCGTSSLTSNVFSLKDVIILSMSYFTVMEARGRSWSLLQSLSISFCSILICCRKNTVEGMS